VLAACEALSEGSKEEELDSGLNWGSEGILTSIVEVCR
jgi:hypothetical protein